MRLQKTCSVAAIDVCLGSVGCVDAVCAGFDQQFWIAIAEQQGGESI
jgi:hypothetical protein